MPGEAVHRGHLENGELHNKRANEDDDVIDGKKQWRNSDNGREDKPIRYNTKKCQEKSRIVFVNTPRMCTELSRQAACRAV